MIRLEINDAGQGALWIEDADGKPHAYRFGPAPCGLSLWALSLTRADTETAYRVCEDRPGRWSCTCPSFKYRRPPCKHIEAARLLRSFFRTQHEEEIACDRQPYPARTA